MFYLKSVMSVLEGNTREKRGSIGEEDVIIALAYISRRRKLHYKIIRDLNIQSSSGKKAQIDLVYINNQGIFIIEVKNWTGYVMGSDSDDKWLRSVNRNGINKKYEYNNPLKQNDYHIEIFKDVTKIYKNIHSLVVFSSNNASRLKIQNVVNITGIPEYLNSIKVDESLKDKDIDDIYNALTSIN